MQSGVKLVCAKLICDLFPKLYIHCKSPLWHVALMRFYMRLYTSKEYLHNFCWRAKKSEATEATKTVKQSFLIFISVWRINSLLSQSLFPVTVLITLHTQTEHYYLFVFDKIDKTHMKTLLQAREYYLDLSMIKWLNLTWWFWRRILIWLWNDCNWSL